MGAGDELTPEMVEAGLEVLWRYDPDYCDGEKYVREIFTAMMAARCSKD